MVVVFLLHIFHFSLCAVYSVHRNTVGVGRQKIRTRPMRDTMSETTEAETKMKGEPVTEGVTAEPESDEARARLKANEEAASEFTQKRRQWLNWEFCKTVSMIHPPPPFGLQIPVSNISRIEN